MGEIYTTRAESGKDFTITKEKFDANIKSILEKYKSLPTEARMVDRRGKWTKVADVLNYWGSELGILKKDDFVTSRNLRRLEEKIKNEESLVMRYLHLIECALTETKTTWNNKSIEKDSHSLDNTRWHLYFIKNEEKKDRLSLASYELTFKKNSKEVLLQSLNRLYRGHYYVNYDGLNVIKVDLKESSVESPDVAVSRELRLLYTNKEAELIEGFMLTSVGTIIYNNAILLEKMEGHKVKSKEHFLFPIFSDRYENQIDENIKDYFSNIELNRNRTGSGGIRSKQNGFRSLIKEKNRITLPYKYELYISAPITSLENENQFILTQKFIKGLILKLKKNGLFPDSSKIYSPATLLDENGNMQSWSLAKEAIKSNLRYKEALDKWKKSRYYMLVMPFNVPSVALIQAAWVFFKPAEEIKQSVFIMNEAIKTSAFLDREHTRDRAIYISSANLSVPNDTILTDKEIEKFCNQLLNPFKGPLMRDVCNTFGVTIELDNIKY